MKRLLCASALSLSALLLPIGSVPAAAQSDDLVKPDFVSVHPRVGGRGTARS